MARTVAILTMALTGIATVYAGSLGINPGDYLNPDGSVSVGLLPTTGGINDGITSTVFNAAKVSTSTLIINSNGGGSISPGLPQPAVNCATNCQGGLTSVPPYAPGTATLFTPASAPEFDMIGSSSVTTAVQAWISNSNGTASAATVTIPVGIFGVSTVNTMLNTIAGLTTGGSVCTAGDNGYHMTATVNTTCGGNGGTNSYAYITLAFSSTATGAATSYESFALMNGVTQANILDGATAGTSGSVSGYSVFDPLTSLSYNVGAGQVYSGTITGGAQNNDTMILDYQSFPVFSENTGLYLTSITVTDTGTVSTNHEVLSAATVDVTPEPSTLVMLFGGLCAVVLVARRRRIA